VLFVQLIHPRERVGVSFDGFEGFARYRVSVGQRPEPTQAANEPAVVASLAQADFYGAANGVTIEAIAQIVGSIRLHIDGEQPLVGTAWTVLRRTVDVLRDKRSTMLTCDKF
jgi:hypothetical protein